MTPPGLQRHLLDARLAGALLALAAACLADGAAAQAGGQPVPAAASDNPASWSALKPAQREALAPLRDDWHHLDSIQQQRWIGIADRFPTMSPEARERAQSRMADWSRMSPEQRGEARLRYREAQRVDPAERRDRWQEFQALTPEQRQQWLERSRRNPTASARVPAAPGGDADRRSATGSDRPTRLAPRSTDGATLRGPTGATTRLLDAPLAAPAAPLQPGRPKIVTSPSLVDRATLLPRTGPQAPSGDATTRKRPEAAR